MSTIKLNAITARLYAIKFEVTGMEVANRARQAMDEADAYGEEQFACAARDIRELAEQLELLAEGESNEHID